MEVTITVDERLLIAICDVALKNKDLGGNAMIQACGVVLNAIQQAKKGNGHAVTTNSGASTDRRVGAGIDN